MNFCHGILFAHLRAGIMLNGKGLMNYFLITGIQIEPEKMNPP